MKRLGERRLVIFESPLREFFHPLSLTRPTFDFLHGGSTILARIEQGLNHKASDLFVPKYLESACAESHPQQKVNEHVGEPCLLVNSLVLDSLEARREFERASSFGQEVVIVDEQTSLPILAILEECGPEDVFFSSQAKRKGKLVRSKQVVYKRSGNSGASPIFLYPWQLMSSNGEAISYFFEKSKTRALGRKIPSESEVKGKRLLISETSIVERFVSFDCTTGPIVIDENATIESFSKLAGPCYIGKNAKVLSAKIRSGTSIGNHCKVSGEVEDSIMFEYSNKSHEGFLGHSIIGSWVNLGAMTTNSDLKNTYGNIKVSVAGKEVDSGMVKLGCFLGDMSKTAIGTMIYTGIKIGVASQVFGHVVRDVPSFTIARFFGDLTSFTELYLKSAIATQERMMKRRNIQTTRGYIEMIKKVFLMTRKERISAKVRRGRFILA